MTPRRADKVVLRFKDGRVLKGYLLNFSDSSNEVSIEETKKKNPKKISVDVLKAIFFVRTFKGDKQYREKKSYSISPKKGKKVYVKFTDAESLLGYLNGELPWQKGFHLSSPKEGKNGFFVYPVDTKGNNIKIYILNSSVKDIALVG